MKRRILSCLLTVAMLSTLFFSAFSVTASAAAPAGSDYGAAATPGSPLHKNAAASMPIVNKKVDLLKLTGKTTNCIINGYQTYGKRDAATNYFCKDINLNVTPYLYYSFSQPADNHVKFGLHCNSPFFIHRDAKTYPDTPGMSTDTDVLHETDIFGSETGCIDLRQYVSTDHYSDFAIEVLSFYRGSANTILNYFFLGSTAKSAGADYDGPKITLNVANNAYVSNQTVITATCDTAVSYLKMRLEGEEVCSGNPCSFTLGSRGLQNGVYTVVAEAKDESGNIAYESAVVRLVSNLQAAYTQTADSLTASGALTAYNAMQLSVTAGFGATSDGTLQVGKANPYDEQSAYKMQYDAGGVEITSKSGIPYQMFDVNLNGVTTGSVALSYKGSTLEGERMALKAYNVSTQTWNTLGTLTGAGTISKLVDVAPYNDGGFIHCAVMLDYVTNGSNKMIWVTDPQHYTKFDDLNVYYQKVYEYAAEQYKNGSAGYALNTGDLVDDRPYSSKAPKEWKVSSDALAIIDAVGMPNGVVTGNHDVDDYNFIDYENQDNTTSNYIRFREYYPASRYNDTAWYGGSINDNTSHYDLVTLGNIDFVIIYLGYGMEATNETVEWVNKVLKTYSHRSAILCTHAYLRNHIADYGPAGRGKLIYDTMVDNNPNVCMVLCGHDDGAECTKRITSDGREIYEILSDYQFVQAEDLEFYGGNQHYIGSVPNCCGDGYLREMSFTGGKMTSITYSPVTGRYNPYGARENLTLDLAYVNEAGRSFTTDYFEASLLGARLASGNDNITVSTDEDWIATIAQNGVTTVTSIAFAKKPVMPESRSVAPVDYRCLQDLIANAEKIEKDQYTDNTYSWLKKAIADAKAINPLNEAEVNDAYQALESAVSGLTVDRVRYTTDGLTSLYKANMMATNWNATKTWGPVTAAESDLVVSQTASGGLRLSHKPGIKNQWPAAFAKDCSGTNAKTITPNGNLYVNLDVFAECDWLINLAVTQDNLSKNVSLSKAVEQSFYNSDAGMAGTFKGVYDVSHEFIISGFDLNKPMKINYVYIYVITGSLDKFQYHVEYNHIELMTDYGFNLLPTKDNIVCPTFSSGGMVGKVIPFFDYDQSVRLTSGVTGGNAWPTAYTRTNVSCNIEDAHIYIKKSGTAKFNMTFEVSNGSKTVYPQLAQILNGSDADLPAGTATYEIDLGAYLVKNKIFNVWDVISISRVTYFVVGKYGQTAKISQCQLMPNRTTPTGRLSFLAGEKIAQSGTSGDYMYRNGTLTMNTTASDYRVTIPIGKSLNPKYLENIALDLTSSAKFNITLNLTTLNGNANIVFSREFYPFFDMEKADSVIPAGEWKKTWLSLVGLYPYYGGEVDKSTINSVTIALAGPGTITVRGLQAASDHTVVAIEDGAFSRAQYPEVDVPTALTSTAYAVADYSVSRVETKTTVADFISKFDQDAAYICVLNKNKQPVASGTMQTAMIVAIVNQGSILREYEVSVIGDVDCDGMITSSDSRMTLQEITKPHLSTIQKLSADFNGDGSVDSNDARNILIESLLY